MLLPVIFFIENIRLTRKVCTYPIQSSSKSCIKSPTI